MIRIEFTEPIEFKQQGVTQLATFVDCQYSTRHSAFTVLIYSGPGDFFIIKANQIEKTYAL